MEQQISCGLYLLLLYYVSCGSGGLSAEYRLRRAQYYGLGHGIKQAGHARHERSPVAVSGAMAGGINSTTVPQCAEFQFGCDGNRCITAAWRCDFKTDCSDGSDEAGCAYSNCTADEFRCGNGRCVADQYRCDGDDDCLDNSDELACPRPPPTTCPPLSFACTNGTGCWTSLVLCDGAADCAGGEDEDPAMCANHTCPPDYFQCASKKCVSVKWRCDSEDDCGDGSDERDCDHAPDTTPPPVPCEGDYLMRCANGRCVPAWWRCDGADDCDDGSDEVDCPADAQPSTTAASTTAPPATCRPTHVPCSDGKCIWKQWLCDGDSDCPDGSDEQDCPDAPAACPLPDQRRCPTSGECVPQSRLCDGQQDCGDNSDEEPCTGESPVSSWGRPFCPRGFLLCDQHTCVPSYRLCDGVPDCDDESDETDCQYDPSVPQAVNYSVDTAQLTATSLPVRWQVNAGAEDKIDILEYLPSICALYYWADRPCRWRISADWTTERRHTFQRLQPNTRYNVTVYVRTRGGWPAAPSQHMVARTLRDKPSAPRHVAARQLNETSILVTWLPPEDTTGPLTKYRLSLAVGPTRPLVFLTNGTNYTVVRDFKPGQLYSVSVQAQTRDVLGDFAPPASLWFDGAALVGPVDPDSVTVEHISDTSVTLRWRWPAGALATNVTVAPPINTPSLVPTRRLSVTDETVTVTGLSPGTRYSVTLQGVHGDSVGRPALRSVDTSGTAIPAVSRLTVERPPHSGTAVKLSWQPPPLDGATDAGKAARAGKLQYGVFYGSSNDQLEDAGPRLVTNATEVLVTGLGPCAEYLLTVAVVGPAGTGRGAPLHIVSSFAAPPEAVAVEAAPGDDRQLQMRVSWSSRCRDLDAAVGYNVTVEELAGRSAVAAAVRHTEVPPSYLLDQWLDVPVRRGRRYRVTVATTAPDAAPAAPVLHWALQLPGPPLLPPGV